MRKRPDDTGPEGVQRSVFVDSGAWIALARARDRHHDEADRLFRLAAARRLALLTTSLVVAEVHRWLLFRVGIRAARTALERVDASALVTIRFTTAAHHAAAKTWLDKFSDQTLTYTDAVSFAVMEAERCRTALSFDHDFEMAGFALWRG